MSIDGEFFFDEEIGSIGFEIDRDMLSTLPPSSSATSSAPPPGQGPSLHPLSFNPHHGSSVVPPHSYSHLLNGQNIFPRNPPHEYQFPQYNPGYNNPGEQEYNGSMGNEFRKPSFPGGAGGGLQMKKSFTLEPSHVGLQQGVVDPVQSRFSGPPPSNVPLGSVGKSYSFDTNREYSDVGKIRKKHEPVPLASVKDSKSRLSNSRAAPYPLGLQHSPSAGSADRLHQIARSGSTLSHHNNESYVSEDDEQPHEGTFEWLSDFQSKEKVELPKSKPIFRACVNCKKAHLACDSERPCKRCVHLGKSATCVDVEHKKRGRPKLPRTEDGTIIRMPKQDRSDDEGEGKKEKKKSSSSKKKEKKSAEMAREIQSLAQPPFPQGGFPESQPTSSPSPSSPGGSGRGEGELEFLSVHTLEGIYSMASPECETLFGFSSQAYVGRSIYEFVHVDDLEHLSALHTNVLSSPEVQKPIILRFKHRLGYHRDCEFTMTVYKSPETSRHQSLICSTRLPPPKSSPPYQYAQGILPPDLRQDSISSNFRSIPPLPVHPGLAPIAFQHSPSFDSLSNSLEGMRFHPSHAGNFGLQKQ